MSIANYPPKKTRPAENNKIIVILGQTATGKSDLAVKLASRLHSKQVKKFGINGAEIISADSRQIYRGLNLGTGKITKKEMDGVPHHLLDVASPGRRFSVAQYKKLAQTAIKKIRRQNKLPIICGGTGFYIQALTDNLEIPNAKPDLKLRARLEKKTAEELFKELKEIDPRRAKNIDKCNPRRLIRALEIIYQTGRPVPKLELSPQPNILFLGLKKSRPELARRIKIRLIKRLKQGMLAEVKKLHAQGLSWKRLDDLGLEYRWLAKYLQKKTSYQEMITRLQKDIEHYAKRQLTWFARDERIIWVKNQSQAIKKSALFLKRGQDCLNSPNK